MRPPQLVAIAATDVTRLGLYASFIFEGQAFRQVLAEQLTDLVEGDVCRRGVEQRGHGCHRG